MTFQKNAPATGDKSGQGGIVSSDKNYTTIKETAKQLKNNGFEILAIRPNSKAPAKGYSWQQVKTWTADRLIKTFPTHGVGLSLGTEKDGHRLIAIDVDIYDRELSQKVADYCFKHFGDPPVRIGQKPKFMAFYLCKGMDKKMKSATINHGGKNSHIEVLTAGQYAVIHNNHPDTGKPFLWVKDSLLNTPLKDLPKIDKSDIKKLFKNFEIDKKSQSLDSEFNQPAPPQDAFETMCLTDEKRVDWSHENINHFINNLNPNMGHDDWLQIGMALHFQFNGAPEGLEIWDQWSQGSGKYKQGEPQRRWDSFKNSQGGDINSMVGFPTLIKKYSHHKGEIEPDSLFINITEILKRDIKPDWLIKNVIPANSIGVFFGDPGSYKSFLSFDMALSIATGTTWHGHEVKQGWALIVMGEGFHGTGKRAKAWLKSKSVDAINNVEFSKHAIYLDDSQTIQTVDNQITLLKAKHKSPPALVVVDTLNKNFSGDDSKGQDFNRFFNNLDGHIVKKHGATVLIIHHSGRGDKTRTKGATEIDGNSDFIYRVEKKADLTANFHCVKQKEAPDDLKLYFEMEPVPLGVDDDGQDISSLVPILKDSPIQEFKLLNTDTTKGKFFHFINDKFQEQQLNNKPLLKFSDIQSQFCKETGTKENTARKYKSEFLNTDINAITINEKGELTGVKEW